MRFSNYFALMTFAALASVASAQTSYTLVRSINIGPHPDMSRFVGGDDRTAGGFYCVDNGNDNIFLVASPLTATGAANSLADILTLGQVAFASGHSSIALRSDGTNLYGGGVNNTVTQYYKIPGQPTAAVTPTALTEPAGTFNGADTYATGKLVAPDSVTGALTFFTESAGTLTIDGTVTISPAAPTGTRFIRAIADVAHNRFFVIATSPSLGGVVYKFNTTAGTPGTTTYSPVGNPYVAGGSSSYPGPFGSGSFYGGGDFDAEDQLLAVATNRGASGQDGFALVDCSQATPTQVQFISSIGTPSTLILDNAAYGAVFCKEGSTKLLVVSSGAFLDVYQKTDTTASAADWSIYE